MRRSERSVPSRRRHARGRGARAASLMLALCLLAVAAGAQTVAAIGGGLQYENVVVWRRLVQAAGGEQARFVIVPTASELPQQRGEQVQDLLRSLGAQAELLPMAPNWPGLDAQAVRDDPAQIERVAAANAVFFTGGTQARITELLQPGGRPTPMLQAIRAVLARGGLIAGTSAGAAILSREMFRDAPRVLDVLAGQLREGQEIDRGLGFVPEDLFIDQHVLKRGRIGRMLPMMQRAGFPLGLGVADNSAVLIHPDGELEVLGETGAVLLDLRQARSDPSLPGFNLQGARLTYLEAGDRYHLRRERLSVGEGKRLLPAQAAPTDARAEPLAGPDLLSDNGVGHALAVLLASEATGLRALSRSPAHIAEGATGATAAAFEFRLSRDEQTRAWRAADASGRPGLSVERVRLDVRVVVPD